MQPMIRHPESFNDEEFIEQLLEAQKDLFIYGVMCVKWTSKGFERIDPYDIEINGEM